MKIRIKKSLNYGSIILPHLHVRITDVDFSHLHAIQIWLQFLQYSGRIFAWVDFLSFIVVNHYFDSSFFSLFQVLYCTLKFHTTPLQVILAHDDIYNFFAGELMTAECLQNPKIASVTSSSIASSSTTKPLDNLSPIIRQNKGTSSLLKDYKVQRRSWKDHYSVNYQHMDKFNGSLVQLTKVQD